MDYIYQGPVILVLLVSNISENPYAARSLLFVFNRSNAYMNQ